MASFSCPRRAKLDRAGHPPDPHERNCVELTPSSRHTRRHRPREILTRNRISHKCKTMEAKERKSFLSGIPSWALSIMTAAFSLIFLFAIGYPLQTHYGENIGGWITYISTGIVITVACFFICRKYPNSVWYTPIICNAVGIIAAIIEPNFWGTSMWIPYLIGWVFSLLGAFSGAWIGRQAATKANL